ncbi:SnoaL-like domain-containing protein [Bradyrhizobium lablabi]|uniref:SnoaL-like domain-containing protein n=1 Tax=Bradyrhizobium lablabi TaxID=722472 RepID=A0A1M7DWU1_9BRAD|nr:nuclear transport factor 2 family protein [Bradyrhizobium lablabi]SHL83981.1 SnoaL-like domain-containing protein [Bradyrhizobium lablabi]
MSEQTEILREIASVITSNGPYRIDQWFTEDFRLVEPTKPNWPRGHEGASKLLDLFRTLTPPVRYVALDMVEQADRVAVRWQLSATYRGEPLSIASMAIYRFKEGRIAEDWGIPIRGEWLD